MAEQKEIDSLKKLSPKDRIKKLKELQQKNKEEIEQAQKMLLQAEDEASVEDQLREIPIPQLKAVDIGELFSPEEQELFKAKRFVSSKAKKGQEEGQEEKKAKKGLESIAETAPQMPREEERQQREYLSQLSRKPAEELYGRAKELYSQFKEQGYLSLEQQDEFNRIEYANRKKLEDIESGKYTDISENAVRGMVTIEKMKRATQYLR